MKPESGPPTGAGAAAQAPLTFEEALTRLEAAVRQLESGDLPLEETLARFEEGQTLLGTCSRLLEQAELKVKELIRRADGGSAEEPWSGEGAGDGGPRS